MPKKNIEASNIPDEEILRHPNVPVALAARYIGSSTPTIYQGLQAACLGCEHRDDWTGCRERCEHVKRRLVHELRKQAAALQETLSKCQQEDLVRALACRVYEYVPSPVIERQRECQRRYVEKNKDKIKAYQQEYYRAKKAREAGGEGKEYESESTVSGVQ